MPFRLSEIIEALNGLEPQLQGDAGFSVHSPAPLAEAGPEQISFFGDIKHKGVLDQTRAGALLIAQDLAAQAGAFAGHKILVKNLPMAWAKTLALWAQQFSETPWGIDPAAMIARTAKLGRSVSVGAMTIVEDRCAIGSETKIFPQCYIGKDVTIGEGCVIYPRVVIRERCKIGSRVIIHPGVVIGADGYGFVTSGGKHHKVPQIGTVEIGDDVEIGANCAIDRAQMGVTRVGDGTKIDNLVQIGHNCTIGKGCLLVSQVGIAGSSTLGDGVVLGGQVGVGDHVHIAAGTIAAGQAGIIGDIKEKDVLWGTPARNIREVMRSQALVNKLPEMYEDFKKRKKAS